MSGTEDTTDVHEWTNAQIIDIAAAMTPAQARVMASALGIIDTAQIAGIIGVDRQRVKMMRHSRIQQDSRLADVPHPNRLPAELPFPGASPLYLRREIDEWARQTGRVNAAGDPIRLRPVGRPPRAGRKRNSAGQFVS